ncbi:MAG: hypothetical protein IPP71_13825 [Bacteroidetes bacterium]|nr:hypothetical protein [Bacteroidota bacterium]
MLSKNRKNFAYLSLDEAFTWVEDSTFTTLRFDDQKEKSASSPSAARAYLQLLYKRFLAY